MHLYIFFSLKGFDFRIFTLAQYPVALATSLDLLYHYLLSHCTVFSWFFFHTLFLFLAMVSKVWKVGGNEFIEDKCTSIFTRLELLVTLKQHVKLVICHLVCLSKHVEGMSSCS